MLLVLDESPDSLSTLLAVVAGAFAEAFGAEAQVSVVPAPDDSAASLTVVVDASRADAARISAARSAGARMRFYDLVIGRAPNDLLEQIDFEFRFPR
jgi:hypothetical protein